MGSRRLRVDSSRSAMQVSGGFPVGSYGSSRSPMQCKVGSRWAPGGFRCCAMWFGVLGWASSGATTLNGSAELRRLRALGGLKLAAPTITHIERKLAPTISPVSAIIAILV